MPSSSSPSAPAPQLPQPQPAEPQIEQWTAYETADNSSTIITTTTVTTTTTTTGATAAAKKEIFDKIRKAAADDDEKKLKKQQQEIDRARREAKKEADEKKRELDEKKRLKRQQQQQFEDDERKRMIEEERRRRLFETEQKLAALDDEKKRKLIEQELIRSAPPSIAPWSQQLSAIGNVVGPSLAEIQKAELERARNEQYRLEQLMREQIQHNQALALEQQQHQKDNVLIWNARNVLPQNIKSLAEIQAEEHAIEREQQQQNAIVAASLAKKKEPIEKRQQQQSGQQQGGYSASSIWNNQTQKLNWNPPQPAHKVWGTPHSMQINPTSSGNDSIGFWDESAISVKTLIKSQTMSNIVPNGKPAGDKKLLKPFTAGSTSNLTTTTNVMSGGLTKSTINTHGKMQLSKKEGGGGGDTINQEFINWCTKALCSISASQIDGKSFIGFLLFTVFFTVFFFLLVPTFVGFLQDIESAYEVKEYIRLYLGEFYFFFFRL